MSLTEYDRQRIAECNVMLRREVLRVEAIYHSAYPALTDQEKREIEMGTSKIRNGIDSLAKLT